jgi:hypothetical protein
LSIGLPAQLKIDDRFTFAFSELWGTQQRCGLEYADIGVVIQYSIPLFRLTQEMVFPRRWRLISAFSLVGHKAVPFRECKSESRAITRRMHGECTLDLLLVDE